MAVRTLLLTDVVDSTKLSEQLGDAAMAELWARHDRVARDLLQVHHGREIDKTDGFLMLFETAREAVAYAVAYHRALRELSISARVGVHVGEVILTENAPADVARGAKPLEVDGIAKPTAARVMSVAAGGQTLLTSAAVDALEPTPELRLVSHGHWRMKGVAEPLELFEVGDEEARFTPPPDGSKVYRVVRRDHGWLPVRQVEHSLPRERDAFVGRTADLLALARLLDDGASLVSVLGIGGTGKTRLVTHFGWTWLGDFPGGVWFCDLSEARAAEDIVSALARALGVPLGDGDPVAQLGHALAARGECLVVFDNFEQVTEHAAGTLGRWLDRAAQARFLVTTREVLGIPGETMLPVAPLGMAESVALFEARAAQARRGFTVSDADMPHVHALVTLLDGLPLAIELAAARVSAMSPQALLSRMSQRFKLLASSGGRSSRQGTLRGALDWSWDLLKPDEQAGLAQLSVFEGGFSLDATEAVLEVGDSWPMDIVQALVDKSLVRRAEDDRFDLLVSVQEYAAEHLEAMGGTASARVRHGLYFTRFGADDARDSLDRHGGVAARRALQGDLDNLVAACQRAVASGDAETAMWTALAAWVALELIGPYERAIATLRGALDLAREDAHRLRLEQALAAALHCAGRTDEAVGRLERALDLARELQEGRQEGQILRMLGHLDLTTGAVDRAEPRLTQALSAARQVGDRVTEGLAVGHLGVSLLMRGRFEEAERHAHRSLEIHREVGHARAESNMLRELGILDYLRGDLDQASARLEQNLALASDLRDRRTQALVLGLLANVAAARGQTELAREHAERQLTLAREVGDRRLEAVAHSTRGDLWMSDGRLSDARRAFEQALPISLEARDKHMEAWLQLRLAQTATGLEVALAHLDAGDATASNPATRAELEAERAVLLWRSGAGDAARAALARAESQVPDGHQGAAAAVERARGILAEPTADSDGW